VGSCIKKREQGVHTAGGGANCYQALFRHGSKVANITGLIPAEDKARAGYLRGKKSTTKKTYRCILIIIQSNTTT
jgi:hypothetical protein